MHSSCLHQNNGSNPGLIKPHLLLAFKSVGGDLHKQYILHPSQCSSGLFFFSTISSVNPQIPIMSLQLPSKYTMHKHMPCVLAAVHRGATCIHPPNTSVYNGRLRSDKKNYRYTLYMEGSHRQMLSWRKMLPKRTYHIKSTSMKPKTRQNKSIVSKS